MPVLSKSNEFLLDALEIAIVLDIVVARLRDTVAGLLGPGIVAHACEDKDTIGLNLYLFDVAHDETNDAAHNSCLARLHLGSQVRPGLLCVSKQAHKDLKGRQELSRVNVLVGLCLIFAKYVRSV